MQANFLSLMRRLSTSPADVVVPTHAACVCVCTVAWVTLECRVDPFFLCVVGTAAHRRARGPSRAALLHPCTPKAARAAEGSQLPHFLRLAGGSAPQPQGLREAPGAAAANTRSDRDALRSRESPAKQADFPPFLLLVCLGFGLVYDASGMNHFKPCMADI